MLTHSRCCGGFPVAACTACPRPTGSGVPAGARSHSVAAHDHHRLPPYDAYNRDIWMNAPKVTGLGQRLLPPGPAPTFSAHYEVLAPHTTPTWKTIDQLEPYPAQAYSRPLLHASKRKGPTILMDMILGERDLENHVRACTGWRAMRVARQWRSLRPTGSAPPPSSKQMQPSRLELPPVTPAIPIAAAGYTAV